VLQSVVPLSLNPEALPFLAAVHSGFDGRCFVESWQATIARYGAMHAVGITPGTETA
jgi:hypothetical protein